MSAVLGGLLLLPGVLLAGMGLYLLAVALAAAAQPRTPALPGAGRKPRLVVLVPAHDEQLLIGRCVRSLLTQTYPESLRRVVVIADNCSDETPAEAWSAGAEVLVRNEPGRTGKGHAMRWAMDLVLAEADPPDAIVVVDGDSMADRDLLVRLAAELESGHEVVQADYGLIADAASPRSEMVRAGFVLFHQVRFRGRARLGMAANLVGNGMLFSRRVLESHPWDAFLGVEDLEYSIRLRLAGIRPRFAAQARVEGPGAASARGVTAQRMRWEGGRFHVMRTHLWPLMRAAIVRRDPRLLDAALDLATPPLALLSLASLAGATLAGAAVLTRLASWWSLVPWVTALLSVPAFVVIGLWAAGMPDLALRIIIRSPGFVGWKLVTYLRLLRGFDVRQWERSDRIVEPAHDAPQRVELAGVPIDMLDLKDAITQVKAAMGKKLVFQVSTINLDFMVRAQRDVEVNRIFRRSDLNLADGAPVVWLARLLGARLPGRVAGSDLVPALLADAAQSGMRVFFLGGENGVAAEAAERLQVVHPDLIIAGVYEPPRAAVEEMNNAEILQRIREAQPDMLLVALGHPKQERWIDLHRDQLPVSVAIGVGCVLDLIAGRKRRAPRWMQAIGLEWTFRLLQEPRRLLGRYLTDAVWMLPLALRTLRARMANPRIAEAARA